MEFMLLFTTPKGSPAATAEGMAPMGRYARELAERKILKRGAPLAHESEAACVRVRDGRNLIHDGPFAESKEVIAGFWIIDVPDREAALEIAKRTPHATHATVEVAGFEFRGEFGDAEKGTPFLLVFRMEPGLTDPGSEKLREMRTFGEGLARTATLFETGKLVTDEPPARIQVRAGNALVTDGPFAESKEAIGGYGLVRVSGREEAIDLALRFPHARWGPVEVREILFFDRI
jgi:hypothetical protein